MKTLILFAAVAGLGLVSAKPPEASADGAGPSELRTGYPACSRTITDRCIQLHERGVATRANLARNQAHGAPRVQRPALARRIRMAGERG